MYIDDGKTVIAGLKHSLEITLIYVDCVGVMMSFITYFITLSL